MINDLHAEFEIASWDETPFDEGTDGAKLTEALVAKTYHGDVEGSSTTKWLMAYAPDQTASFVGLERINGTIGGRKGTLVLRHVGTFENGAAKATLTVLSGSAELEGTAGSGDFVADPAGSLTLTLE